MKQKTKLIVILVVEFVAIAAILLMIFFAGKKTYTVTFDLNGGTLISGDLEQRVTQGQNASPPQATKEGCYFLKWSTSYNRVTRDLTVVAIWEYETTYGIEYESAEDSNYCIISGCFADLTGDVYLGAYHNEKKVLGIKAGAFENCEDITSIYLLDGIISIGERAFAGCTSLEKIEMPSTLSKLGANAFDGCSSLQTISLQGATKHVGANAFRNCTSLTEVILGEETESIGAGAFAGCTSLKEIVFPLSLATIGSGAFDQAGLQVYACVAEADKPAAWAADWCLQTPVITWEYVLEEETEVEDEEEDKK